MTDRQTDEGSRDFTDAFAKKLFVFTLIGAAAFIIAVVSFILN